MSNSTALLDGVMTFGPSRAAAFDFTLPFEDTVFTIMPASLFLVAACVRTAVLFRSPAKVESTSSRQIKVAFISAFVALQLTVLLLSAITPRIATKASVAAACLDFAAASILFVLSSYEHTRSVAPSTLIGIYLVMTLPLDIARARTLFLLDNSLPTKRIGAVVATSTAVKIGVLFSEATSKRLFLLANYQHLPPEATSGPYSKSFFWWINPLLRRGFSRILEVGDLYAVDDSLSSTVLRPKFQEKWKLDKKTHKHSLLKVVCSVMKWHLIAAALPRLLLSGLKYAQPFLIQRTINYVSDRQNQPMNIGWGLVGAYAIVYTGLGLLTAIYNRLMTRFIVRVRGGLVSLIYQKTVDLSITGLGEGAALTLMSTDVERITQSLLVFHDAWGSMIEVAIGIYLLYRNLGAGCIAPGVCFTCAALAVTVCIRFFPRFQKIWVEGIQSRVSFTSTMLGSMRSIKLLGISAIASNLTQKLRVRENILARKMRWLLLLQILFQNITPTITPVATFTVYVFQANAAGRPLATATAFSILSLLQLMETPMALLVNTLPALVASIGCFTRVQNYLTGPSRQDHRLSLWNTAQNPQTDLGGLTCEESIELRDTSRLSEMSSDNIIILNECSFGWSAKKPVLHDINMQVKRGSFVMVIGPTGCGKSTLVKGILGETPSSTGFVYMATNSIAFGDQDPWTVKSTIRDGVCGESLYNETLYQEVLDCCRLREDLKDLPKGDLTIVGSKGISLSGGQKHRLALARAIFARKDILILDDVFSGLDADTEEQIFRRLFGESGPIRRYQTTTVLVTHAVARLPYADWVVAFTKDGKIAEQGTYQNLQSGSGYVASLAIRFKQAGTETIGDSEEEKKPAARVTEVNEERAENLSARKTGDWTTYKHYFAALGWPSTALTVVWTFSYIALIRAPGLLVNFFTGPDTTVSDNRQFLIILGITAGLALFSIAMLVWQTYLDMIPRASNGLHHRLLNTVMMAPLSFFTKTDSGTTLNRFSQDLTVIDNELPNAFISSMLQIALFLIGFGLMVATATYFLATIPVVIIAIFIIQGYYLRTSRQLRHLELESKAPLYSHFQETISGLASIRAFGWVEQNCTKNLELLDRSQRPYYLLFCIQRWLALVLDLLVAALATILISIVVSLRHKLDPGLVGLGLLNVMNFGTTLSDLVKLWTLMETSIGAIARVRDFSNTTESEVETKEDFEPVPEWPASGAVEISGFAASYSKSSELVLKDVNLSIRLGEKFGICGRSGSGKSSLLASLFHLLEFREGSICIDGQDTSFVPREVLRQRFNVIPQEPYWISTETVRFNLDPWCTVPQNDAALIAVLTKCQIWHVIEEKGGLDVKMDAEFLSHGQRQLFCLARSLLRKSTVVVLDEVSASVDVQTDSIMQAIIREDFKDCTVISVAHRLNTIVDFDRVAVLHAGRIIECDTPQNLLSRPDSRFKELYEL